MTKGEKLEQRYVNASWEEVEVDLDMDNGQRGSIIEECEQIKNSWTSKAHKQGEQANKL